jgi:hypothetical protein
LSRDGGGHPVQEGQTVAVDPDMTVLRTALQPVLLDNTTEPRNATGSEVYLILMPKPQVGRVRSASTVARWLSLHRMSG